MGSLFAGDGMKLKAKLQRAWRAWTTEPPAVGAVIPAESTVISDGVDYRLPLILPSHLPPGITAQRYLEDTQQQTMRFQFDAPYRSGKFDSAIVMPTEDPLEEWSFDTRKAVLTNCHAAYQRNPLAKQAVQIMRQFAVGKGAEVVCRNKDVEDVLTEFMADPENAYEDYQKTFLQDLMIDGELFIRKFVQDGRVKIVPLRPWDIPFIETDPQFFRRVRSYRLSYQAVNQASENPIPEPVDISIPAEDVLHTAINRHSYELRGRSDLFTILPWLRAYKEWLENRARQNKWRNSLLYDVTISAGTRDAVANAAARYRKPPPDGSIIVHSDKETWQSVSNPSSAGDVAEDGRQIKLMAAVGMGLPEYMLSDGSNANLASATAQQLPALWKFTDAQQIMAEQVWKPIFKWVIQAAIDAGILPEMVEVQDAMGEPKLDDDGKPLDPINAVEAFEIHYPELQSSDPKTLVEALTMADSSEYVSQEGARGVVAPLFGLDPSVEERRIETEKEERRDEAGQGLAGLIPPDNTENPNEPPAQQPGQDMNGTPDVADRQRRDSAPAENG